MELCFTAVAAGGKELDHVNYDYEYRQGFVADPFGHRCLLKKDRISNF